MTTTTRRVVRMPDEIEVDNEPVPGSWLRIIGRFDWSPSTTVGDSQIPTGKTFAMERMASGVCYHAETPMKVREVIETYMGNHDVRLSLNYGDVETGEDWLDEWDMEGYINCTTGRLRSPMLVNNSRSSGGGTILDRCIIRIKLAKRSGSGGDLYRHPLYHADREKHRGHIPDSATEERVWLRRFA